MTSLPQTNRSRLRRAHERGHYDRATLDAILDAQPLAHVGYVLEGKPMVTATFQWRVGDRVYWHGSRASRALRASAGLDVCLTVSILDGFVMARSGFHHSVNSRSIMLLGRAFVVPDDEKEARLNAFVDGLWPGRAAMLRPDTAQEIKATTVLGLEIAEGSAKIRTGGPKDDAEDYALPIWAGVIPVQTVTGAPDPDPLNLPGVDAPDHIRVFRYLAG